MPKLPCVPGRDVVRAFERAGFVVARTSSSHHIMKKVGHPRILSVPVHGHTDVKPGTLRGLIKAAGITVEQFFEYLHGSESQ